VTFRWYYICKRKHSRWAWHTSGGKCRKITSVFGGRSLRGLLGVWSNVWGVTTGWWGQRGYPWVGSYCQGRNWRVCQTTECAGRMSDPHLKSLWWRKEKRNIKNQSTNKYIWATCSTWLGDNHVHEMKQSAHLEEWSLS